MPCGRDLVVDNVTYGYLAGVIFRLRTTPIWRARSPVRCPGWSAAQFAGLTLGGSTFWSASWAKRARTWRRLLIGTLPRKSGGVDIQPAMQCIQLLSRNGSQGRLGGGLDRLFSNQPEDLEFQRIERGHGHFGRNAIRQSGTSWRCRTCPSSKQQSSKDGNPTSPMVL